MRECISQARLCHVGALPQAVSVPTSPPPWGLHTYTASRTLAGRTRAPVAMMSLS